MENPLVSVVMPFLNMGRFLRESTESVLAQTYPDWELIIVDDGSAPEEKAAAVSQAARQPERIRFLDWAGAKPSGASAARNRGIREARGKYLALLDADDIWLPEKLDRQVRLLEQDSNVAMTFARVHYFYDEGGSMGFDQPFPPLIPMTYPPPDILPIFLAHKEVYPCPTATLVRLEAFRSVGCFEEGFRKIRTDLTAWTKLGTHFPIVADDAVVARYRQHPGSSVSEADRSGTSSAYDRRYYDWALHYVEGLPGSVRRALEPILCKDMLYLTVEYAHTSGFRSSLGWRLFVLGTVLRYPAFRRQGRWLRAIRSGVLDHRE